MDYDNPIMENLLYHAFNYRNAHSTQASNDFNTLEEFVSQLGIAAGKRWREEWSEVCNENQVLINRNQALLEALQLAEESMGEFVSDHGWRQRDMDNFDTVCAAIKLAEGKD